MKDFAPDVPQYIQVFRPETKMHIEHAEILICEDEFKYSLLANNCICPGISTFITLLMHTSRGEEGQKSTEPWHKIYGFHSGNEIYDIVVGESKFFGEFIGKTFVFASFYAHEYYGVNLLGVKREGHGERIMLNPGHSHVIQSTDRFYYVGLTNEESISSGKGTLKSIPSNVQKQRKLEPPTMDTETHTKLKNWRIRRALLKKSKGITTSDADALIEGDTNKLDQPENDRARKSSVGVVTGEKESSSSSDSEDECEICGEEKCFAER